LDHLGWHIELENLPLGIDDLGQCNQLITGDGLDNAHVELDFANPFCQPCERVER